MNFFVHFRAVAIGVAAACVARALYDFQVTGLVTQAWWLMLAGLLLAALAHLGMPDLAPPPAPPPLPPSRRRRWLGIALTVAGALLWGIATARIYRHWASGFDFAWIGWSCAAVLLCVGLDLAWGVWPRARPRRWLPLLLPVAALLAIAGVYRLGNIADFPGEAAITQIEDLQVGNFGWAYLNGYRLRWEYLSSTWLAALGIWLGGHSQLAMRLPFAIVSALKVLPLFIWLRWSVGTTGALVGAALLATSFWDVTLSRIPNNHNGLVVALVFSLLAGPARRGRPSAYVLLGFFGAYVLHEYIAYRPLAVFGLVGAVMLSLRDRGAGWMARLARPLITVVLLVTMAAPLFLTRIPNTISLEYFDGWNRARGIAGYYNPQDDWRQSLQRRWQRAQDVGELFTIRGDRSPVRNVAGQPPLVDPVTCGLLLLGIGAAAAQALRPVHGLTLLGLLVTVSGTLILTGNFDVARVGGAVPYVYALAGFAAAGLWAAWGMAWGRLGRVLAALLLAAGVAWSAWWSTNHLFSLWHDPVIRRAHRSNLAYLTIWMRDYVRPGERVLGIAPGYTNALEGHDGSWLRGREVEGYVGWDIETALRQWAREPGPTLLFVYAGSETQAIAEYLSYILPGTTFEYLADPLSLGADIAFARLPGPPPELHKRLADWRCRGVRAEYRIVGPDKRAVLFELHAVAPFISKSCWPAAVPDRMFRLTTRPGGIETRFSSPFIVAAGGDYLFSLDLYGGSGSLYIDGKRRDSRPVTLQPGPHMLEVKADFAPMGWEPSIRLLWSGPDTGGRQELMPFYRLAPVDPSCPEAAGQLPIGDGATRAYLKNWLTAGPYDNSEGKGMAIDYIGIARLFANPAAAGEARWVPIAARDSFVDLDGFYAPAVPNRSPEYTCAYALTTIEAEKGGSAFLEMAGSGDTLEIWLNGENLTPSPLAVRYDPMRRPVRLRKGENLLVVKSCEDVGAWYFVARLTDAEGRELSGLRSSAALPSQPIPAPAPPPIGPQIVEGLAGEPTAPHASPSYGDYRGGGPSWWAYVEDRTPEVVWRTAPLPERKPTIVALTASMSPENGSAELHIDGRRVIDLPIGTHAIGGRWQADGYAVAFDLKGFYEGNSGILTVSVPAEAVTPGQPLELRLVLKSGHPRTWFMVKGYTDTTQREPIAASGATAAAWSPAK